MDKQSPTNKPANWFKKLNKLLLSFMYLLLMLFGLYPFTKLYFIYQIYIILWYCGNISAIYSAFIYNIFGDEHSLSGLVNTIMFAAHIGAHFAVLAESSTTKQYRMSLHVQFKKLQQRFETQLHKPLNSVDSSKRIFFNIVTFYLLLISGHSLIMWTTFKTKSPTSLLYSRSLNSLLALQFKSFEFFTGIAHINYYILTAHEIINEMGERNLRRVFKTAAKSTRTSLIIVVSKNQEQEDEKQIAILKASYSDIYSIFQQLNVAYGWSLLASTAVYFVDFVCNTYWILLAVITQVRDYYALLQNVSFALLAFLLLSLICWMCEESYYQSRYIGCLISKLVKPLGNKHYNDLVSEFSVQTLHQRFIITAKDFFTLNLSLLGRMVAAIVTYLIILIQFMFNEKRNNESALTQTSIVNSTTPISAITDIGQSLLNNVTTTTFKHFIVSTTLKSLMENVTTNTLNGTKIQSSN